MQSEIVLVRFESDDGKLKVLLGGIYHFENKPLIVKGWLPKIEFLKEELMIVTT